MRKMDKVFREKGITFEPDETMMWYGPEYDCDRKIVEITDKFIIAVYSSAVLEPILYLYDRFTLNLIGTQLMYPEQLFNDRTRTWMAWVE